MLRRLIKILGIAVVTAHILSSCEEITYSSSPHHLLSFSTDTIKMDTLLTGVGTQTHILRVYNNNDENLLISTIQLANASQTGFRINVDGMKGYQFSDIELRSKDSLHIFIEATLPPSDKDLPVFWKDSIVFITNGTPQDVKLLAYGQDFLSLKGKLIKNDTIIASKRPIVIMDSLCVLPGAKLTLEAGTELYFHGDAFMRIEGQIKATGTLQEPVVFRGDRTDHMFDFLPYDKLPGQWGGIQISQDSYENELNFIQVYGGMYGIRCDSASIEREKLKLTNSIIHQVSGNGLEMTNCKASIANSLISNAGKNCVSVLGGEYTFVHTTLANYFSWSMKRGVALAFANERNEIAYPLQLISFKNCLIAGSSNDEISGSRADNDEIPFNYYFSHCVVNSIEEVNSQIEEVLWKKDDHFKLMDSHAQRYNFELDSLSVAIDNGLRAFASDYPYDLIGNSRLLDEAPDAGCYEWIPTANEDKEEDEQI